MEIFGIPFHSVVCYFVLFSLAGYVCEVVYAALVTGKFVNRGFLSGPYCPIYGFGIVIVAAALRPFLGHPLLLFLFSVALTSALEYLSGWLLDKAFGKRWWDYTDEPFNLGGYICLRFSLLWGLACMGVLKLALPAVDLLLGLIPDVAEYIVAGAVVAAMLTDLVVTGLSILKLNRRLRQLDAISSAMRRSSDLLGSLISRETLELKEKYDESELRGRADGLKELYSGTLDRLRDKYDDGYDELKAKYDELKDRYDDGADALRDALDKLREKYETEYDELKGKYDELLERVEPGFRRLVDAFPKVRLSGSEVEAGRSQDNFDALKSALTGLGVKYHEKIKRQETENARRYADDLPEGAPLPFAHGLCYSKLFILFFIGCFIGFLVETLWCLVVVGDFEYRTGVVWGPFIPVYGFGAVLITLALYRLRCQRDLWIFLGSAVVGGAFEYICSLFQELVFGTVSWEYSDTPLNFGGRTNVTFAFFWGILGLLWLKDLYPRLSKWIEKIPKKSGGALVALLTVFMAANMLVSSAAVLRWNDRRDNIPPSTSFDEWLDSVFPDSYLEFVYPNMLRVDDAGSTD